MVKIIAVNKESDGKKKTVNINQFRNTFSSMDSFSKIMGVTFVILIVLAPILISAGTLRNVGKAALEYSVIPVDNSTVLNNSTVVLSINTPDTNQVSKAQFYVDGQLICDVKTSPYICAWNVPNEKNRQYIIETKLYDQQGSFYTKTEKLTSNK